MNIPTPRLTPRSGLVAALVLLSAGSATASSVQYLVTVNTSPVNTTSGFLDFQFNPGDASSQSATAQIMNFNSGGGTLVFNLGSPQASLSVSGTLPDTVTLVNGTPVNDYFQEFTYGDFFSFVLSLTGPALGRSVWPGVGESGRLDHAAIVPDSYWRALSGHVPGTARAGDNVPAGDRFASPDCAAAAKNALLTGPLTGAREPTPLAPSTPIRTYVLTIGSRNRQRLRPQHPCPRPPRLLKTPGGG